MNPAAERHPGPEQLAAFIDGKLSRQELVAVADHLRGCAECSFIVREAATLERESTPAGRVASFSTPRRWLAVAAVIALAVIGAIGIAVLSRSERDPISRLAAAAPHDTRRVEARLSGGFPWARLRPTHRGAEPPDAGQLKLDGVAGSILGHDANPSLDSDQAHAEGLAYLLTDQRAHAVERLREATTRGPANAAAWNDLGGALYASATRDDRPSDLPLALGAIDRALAIDQGFVEARFNRALVLEREGLLTAAQQAWRDYLRADPDSKWSEEAREHLRHLRSGATGSGFPSQLEPALVAAQSGNPDAIGTLVRTFPQESRSWGEGPLLARWAEAAKIHDDAKALRELSGVRAISRSLSASGEWLLSDAMRAIDRATPGDRLLLAEASVLYDIGRRHYSRRLLAEAEKDLTEASALFRRGRSPLADVASLIAANTMFDQNRPVEAEGATRSLLGHVDRDRYRALFAQEMWEIAMCDAERGRWSAASEAAARSAGVFHALGETANETVLDMIRASFLDHIAQYDESWRIRIPAFDRLSRSRSPRLASAIANAIRCEARRGEYASALALTHVAVDNLRSSNDALLLTDALMQRARACHALQDEPCATAAITRARTEARRIPDPATRKKVAADADVVQAVVQRNRNPPHAVELSSSAIAFYESTHFEQLLPGAYLARGRAQQTNGNDADAIVDYERGLDEIDRQRATVVDLDARSRFLDLEPEIFGELIDLYLSRGDVGRAFTVSERFRARALDEGSAARPAAVVALDGGEATPDSTTIEYAWTPSGVAIFCLTARGIQGTRVVLDHKSLVRDISAFRDLIRRGAPLAEVTTAGGSLYQRLVRPIENCLEASDTVTIVADRELQEVPFAALYDSRRQSFLVERYAVGLAPSVRFLRQRTASSSGEVLVVGNSAGGDSRLPEAEAEAQAIAGLYSRATLLIGAGATREQFLRAAPRSSLIHFAGHARTSDEADGGLLQFGGADQNSSDVTTADIAALRLSRAPLVTLAACGTFQGGSSHLEGAANLNRAFLSAGASAVIGTLWEIEDRTASRFFRDLHARLRQGDSAWKAARQTQLSLLHSSDQRMRHPQSWAAVEVLGNGVIKVRERSAD